MIDYERHQIREKENHIPNPSFRAFSEFRSKKWNLAWRIESTRPVYSLPPVSDYIQSR